MSNVASLAGAIRSRFGEIRLNDAENVQGGQGEIDVQQPSEPRLRKSESFANLANLFDSQVEIRENRNSEIGGHLGEQIQVEPPRPPRIKLANLGDLTSKKVATQSGGENFRASMAAPFKRFGNWFVSLFKKDAGPNKISNKEFIEGASLLSGEFKAAGRPERLVAFGDGVVNQVMTGDKAPAEWAEITGKVGEVLGMGEHVFGLIRNIRELKDRSDSKKDLQRLENEAANLKDLTKAGKSATDDVVQGFNALSETKRDLDLIGKFVEEGGEKKNADIKTALEKPEARARLLAAMDISEFALANKEVNEQTTFVSERIGARLGTLGEQRRTQQNTLEKRVDFAKSKLESDFLAVQAKLKGKDGAWLLDRIANSVRYGVNIPNTLISVAGLAQTVGSTTTTVLSNAVGGLNLIAGGISTHRAVVAGRDEKAAEKGEQKMEANIGKRMGARVVDEAEGSRTMTIEAKDILLEQKRRSEKNIKTEKSTEKKAQAFQAADYFARAAVWIAGITVAAVVGVGIATTVLTGAGLVLGLVGAGIAVKLIYNKFQRQAEQANKIAGLQELSTALSAQDAKLETAREGLVGKSRNPELTRDDRKRATMALKLLDSITTSTKYDKMVGRVDKAPLTEDQVLDIASYKLAIRNNKPVAETFVKAFRDEIHVTYDIANRPPHPTDWKAGDERSQPQIQFEDDLDKLNGPLKEARFLKTELGWSNKDIAMLYHQAKWDPAKAADIFLDKNKLDKYKTI